MSQDQLKFALLEYLKGLKTEGVVDGQAVDTALASLSSAFNMDVEDPKQIQEHSFYPSVLPGIFEAGIKGSQAKTIEQDMAEMQANPAFKQYMDKITEKGFFRGVEEGSKGYLDRYLKAALKFKEKLKDNSGATPRAAPVKAVSEEDLAKAEDLKAKGNEAIKSKDYTEAEAFYTEAIAVAPQGPNTHIYYCNRAAARSFLEDFAAAVDDCEKAIKLDPTYVKAYSRLGAANYSLSAYEAAIAAYKKGLEVDPGNSGLKEGLDKAESKIKGPGSNLGAGLAGLGGLGGLGGLAGLGGGAGGMPDLSAALGGMGGMGGISGLMQNPAFMNMATKLMSDPNMMAQAQQMMQNPAMRQQAEAMMMDPSALNRMMGGLGGEGAGATGGEAAGGTPDLAELLKSFKGGPGGDDSGFNPDSI